MFIILVSVSLILKHRKGLIIERKKINKKNDEYVKYNKNRVLGLNLITQKFEYLIGTMKNSLVLKLKTN